MVLKKKKIFSVLIFACILPLLLSWGTFGHEHINHAAVLALPPPLQTFFYNHIDFLTQESTVPDLRKYTLNDKAERPRHYIDLENFGNIDSIPRSFEQLKKKYDEEFLSKNGILPWYLETMMERLTKAFKEKRKTEILFLAADLGHYIGDAHMPLHTTVNHDGELTNQKGIHAFWEAHLPDLFGNSYNLYTPIADYITALDKKIWLILISSHSLADTLLIKEKQLRGKYPADKIYSKTGSGEIEKNKFGQPIHSYDYAKSYHDLLNGMVEQQMKKAIKATADFWYTAWINAGKPDLSDLDEKQVTKRNEENLKLELKLWEKGKLSGVLSEREF
jgi:hypothetical protein